MSPVVAKFIDIVRHLRSDKSHAEYSLEGWEIPETLGKELAALLAPLKPEAVVVWAGAPTAVLGHVVARELSAKLVYAFADEGLLGLSSELPAHCRTVAVSYDWTEYPGLVSMEALLTSHGVDLSGVGSVLTVPEGAESVDVTVLETVTQ